MKKYGKAVSFILTVVLLFSMSAVVFADTSSVADGPVKQTARTVNALGTNNDCLWKGHVILTNPSGRNLVLEGEAYAYHKVNQLGFTLYLERKATSNGIVSTVATYSHDAYNTDYTDNIYAKTVSQSGYYRISAIFNSKHTIHQTEMLTAYTSWMWVD